ncbi:hypothetical protein [Kitasatospora sp. NPDC004272]
MATFAPEAQRHYDELTHVLQNALPTDPADDAIGLLDALLSAHWEQTRDEALAEARARVEKLSTANDGQLIAATREQILNAITRTGQKG